MLPRTLSTTSSLGAGHPVQNIVNEDATGYIMKEKLEARLHFLFGYSIEVRHVNGRYYFEAPRVVTEDEIDDLREIMRVN